jgi:hypothetical protein
MPDRTMMQSKLFLAAVLALAAGRTARADGLDAPLAVTTLARPSLSGTPTLGQQEESRRHLNAGLDLLKRNLPERAVQAFNDSVRLDPGADNYKALGTAYYQSGNRLKAAWAYGESLRYRADPNVQALADSLRAGDGAPAGADPAYYRRAMDRAAADEKAGAVESAIRDYLDAYRAKPGAESASPCLRLASLAVARDLAPGTGSLSKAVELLIAVAPLKDAAGLDAEARDSLRSLDGSGRDAERRSGMNLKDNEKAMLAGHDAWAQGLDRADRGAASAAPEAR